MLAKRPVITVVTTIVTSVVVVFILIGAVYPAFADSLESLKFNQGRLYTYRAHVTKVYDGDTITVDIDLGFGIWKRKTRLRLARINAPELRGSKLKAREKLKAIKARDWLAKKINNKYIIIQTIKDKKGKYGRYIAEIWLDGRNINDELVAKNLAKYRKY